ncbi:Zinc finger protein [Entamoeba marina]
MQHTDSETLDIGTPCGVCSVNDFLPIICPNCHKPFCNKHIGDHNCPNKPTNTVKSIECPICESTLVVQPGENPDMIVNNHIEKGCKKDIVNKYQCHFCKKREMVEIRCQSCNKPCCISHRSPHSHQCISLEKKQSVQTKPQQSKPQQTLPKSIPTTIKTTQTTNPQVMRMKRQANLVTKAKGDPSVSKQRRKYIEIIAPDGNVIYTWVDSNWTAGVMLDNVCKQFGIPNQNNVPNKPKTIVMYEDNLLDLSTSLTRIPNYSSMNIHVLC